VGISLLLEDEAMITDRKTISIVKACELVGVSRRTIYGLTKNDEDFKFAYDMALQVYRERLECEIHRRAVDGWDEPVFYRGSECGTIRKHSDNLLMFQAKRHIPEYREKQQVDVNVSGGVLLVHAALPDARDWEKHARVVEQERTGHNGNGNGNGGG